MATRRNIDAKRANGSVQQAAKLVGDQYRADQTISVESGVWLEYLGQPLLHAFDVLWHIATEKLLNPTYHERVWKIRQHLDSVSTSRWPRLRHRLAEIADHIPAVPPTQAAMALGPRWWVSIDSANLAFVAVPEAEEPLTYGEEAAAQWVARIRRCRAGALSNAFYPLISAIASGSLRLTGFRQPAAADSQVEEIPRHQLELRQWSFCTDGLLTIAVRGQPTQLFSSVEISTCKIATASKSMPSSAIVDGNLKPFDLGNAKALLAGWKVGAFRDRVPTLEQAGQFLSKHYRNVSRQQVRNIVRDAWPNVTRGRRPKIKTAN